MKNNKSFKCIIKYFWIYVISIFSLYLLQYINSLTGLFIGEGLAILNGDEHILPSFLLKFMNLESKKSALISLSTTYIIISSLGILTNIITRMARVVYCEKTYICFLFL